MKWNRLIKVSPNMEYTWEVAYIFILYSINGVDWVSYDSGQAIYPTNGIDYDIALSGLYAKIVKLVFHSAKVHACLRFEVFTGEA